MTRNRLVRVGILVVVTAVVGVATFVPLGSGSSSAQNGTPSPAAAVHHCITRVAGRRHSHGRHGCMKPLALHSERTSPDKRPDGRCRRLEPR